MVDSLFTTREWACRGVDVSDENLKSFDEAWYLASHPDVAIAIQRGTFASGFEHYIHNGRQEGRFASAEDKAIKLGHARVFAIGAYGTNNVGDEAIFDGIRVDLPDCIPIHIGKSDREGAVFFEAPLKTPNFFRSTDRLIVGGGGLLYDPRAIGVLTGVAEAAKRSGATVEILGLGCEAAQPEFYPDIVSLTDLADRIVVRSSISQELMKKITGRDVEKQNDFAFRLPSRLKKGIQEGDDSIPNIAVVTSGDVLEDISELCRVIRTFTAGNRLANFFHIPHSKAYFHYRNNDVLVGQAVWSSIEIHSDDRESHYVTEPFSSKPAEVLKRYERMDGIISRRYHGLLFATIMKLPYLAMNSNSLKNRSFIVDHGSALTHTSVSNEDLFHSFERFYDNIIGHRRQAFRVSGAP